MKQDRDRVRRVVESVVDELLPRQGALPPAPKPPTGGWKVAPFYVGDPKTRQPLIGARGLKLQPGAERRVAIGSDHGGFALKKILIEELRELDFQVEDCGTYSTQSCDYPDFAQRVGEQLQRGQCRLGIMIDGAGIGSAMALNKMRGVRAATVHNEATAINSREHNDANVLVLGSGQLHSGHARRLARIWLATPHAGGRHAKRVDKINALDG